MSDNVENLVEKVADENGAGGARNEAVTFSEKFIRSFPRSNKKIPISVMPFSLKSDPAGSHDIQSMFISPHGIEFQAAAEFKTGTLLKIEIALPDFWTRKQKVVEYRRIDVPEKFRILAKVMKVDDVGKRGRKKHIIAQTVNLDAADEQVLRKFLEEG
jgi:hypothetical protein